MIPLQPDPLDLYCLVPSMSRIKLCVVGDSPRSGQGTKAEQLSPVWKDRKIEKLLEHLLGLACGIHIPKFKTTAPQGLLGTCNEKPTWLTL